MTRIITNGRHRASEACSLPSDTGYRPPTFFPRIRVLGGELGCVALRAVRQAAIVAAALLSSPAIVWAQEKAAAPTKSYVGPYALVVMLITFGMLVVCRSSRRSPEVKLEP